MFIKIIGIFLVCTCSTFSGVYFAFKIKFHINDLRQICAALNILKSEIEFGITPLNQAAKNICTQFDSFISEIFGQINEELEKKLCPAKQIWIDSVNSVAKKIYADSDDIASLKSFATVISNLDRQLQIKSLQKIILQAEKKISFLELKYQNEKKLCCNLGLLFGLLIAVIFI